MRKTIFIGQCGNQIGCRFWDLALREHASVNKQGIYDEALGSFFHNVQTKDFNSTASKQEKGKTKVQLLKARSVLIDMEEGVVSEIMKGPLREVFDYRQLITDVSGSGNNWAVGHMMYGPRYHENIVESIRRAAESCDCLQCFFVIHSMGGGTGSGVGTYVLRLLRDEYPDVYRFVTAVYPSAEDDVITSPYNSVLAMHCLTEAADCVLPIENQALVDIVNKIYKASPQDGKQAASQSGVRMKAGSALSTGEGGVGKSKNEKPFDSMNNIVANLLLNMTSSSRFEGSLNVDLNEITMNLVPFPRLHYLVSSQSPLYALADIKQPPRRLDQMFSDAFSADHQLIKADPKHRLYLACALMVRGKVEVSDVRRNIERLKPSLKFIHWNQEGWKTGMCSVPPVGHNYSMLTLANNTCVKESFVDLRERFNRLYRRKAHVHHYTDVDDFTVGEFAEALQSIDDLIGEYDALDKQSTNPPPVIPRLTAVI